MNRTPMRFITVLALIFIFIPATHAADQPAPDLKARLRTHVETLASPKFEGRLSGSRGEMLSRLYIAQYWKGAGLKSAAPDYLQCFDMTTAVEADPASTATLKFQGTSWALGLDREFTPMALSGNARASGPVIFAGYGITAPEMHYDDYKNVDAHGRIVLILEHEPQENDPHSAWDGTSLTYFSDVSYKITNAREHGAAGVMVMLDGPRHPDWKTRWSAWRQSHGVYDAGIPVIYLDYRAMAEKIPGLAEQMESWIKTTDENPARRTSLPLKLHAELDVKLQRKRARACNVAAVIPGRDPKKKAWAIVLGAHYDHLGHGEIGRRDAQHSGEIHPGADDNASGTAVLLELGRLLRRQGGLDHTVMLVAFTGEERGLLGSRYYVEHPLWPLDKTLAMINLDMVGRLRDKIIVFGTETAAEWSALLPKAGFAHRVSSLGEGYGPSDHTSFFLKKIPVLHVFTGSHADHHQPTDTPEKLNWNGMVEITRGLLRLLEQLDAQPRLTYQASTRRHGSPQMASGPRMRVRLGTIPDYSYEGEGVRLMGVKEGGAAAQAGLQSGDVIVHLGEHRIRNIYDYTYALGDLQPDRPVPVEILRNGRKLTLKIVPKGRK